MTTIDKVVQDFRKISPEYAYDPDIMAGDEARVARVKEIIDTRLSSVDKTILLLYVDCQSFRKLGARLGISHMTCRKEVLRIRDIILNEYNATV